METQPRLLAIMLATSGALMGAFGLYSGAAALSAFGLLACVAASAIAILSRSRVAPALPSRVVGPPDTGALRDDSVEMPAQPNPSQATTAQPTVPGEESGARRDATTAPVGPCGPALSVAPLSSDPVDIVAALAHNAAGAGEVLSAHLWLEDSPSATVRLITAWGTQRPGSNPVDIQSSTLGRALSSGSAVLRPEFEQTTADGSRTVWRFAVPVESGDARGVAAIDLVAQKPDGAILNKAAADMRPALTGAMAIHVAQQESSAARVLLKTARDISRLVDPQTVAEMLLERAVDMAGAETGSVMLLSDDGSLQIAVARGLPDSVVVETKVSEGEGIAGWVLATGKPLVVEDLKGRTARSRRHGVRSAVAVPIADDDGVLGVLNVGAREFKARFSRSHMDALESLGRIGAVALRNARAQETSRDLYFDTLKALALALETKDPYATGTTEKVLDLATVLGLRLSLDSRDQQALRVAALLHDVGMAAVGDAAAVSDRPLSTVEWGLLKMHPVIAADVIAQAPALHDAVPIVYHHHEHFDGQGYVVGIAGEHIPLGARILAVADAYTAMTSDRPYRRARSRVEALAEIASRSGTQFDPDVVTALVDALGNPSMSPSTEE